jgi:IS30 family transposase
VRRETKSRRASQGKLGLRLTTPERREVLRRMFAGEDVHAVAASCGLTHMSVHRILRLAGGLKSRVQPRSGRQLSAEEREEISRGIEAGFSVRGMAKALGRAASTVSREIRRNGGRCRYRARRSDQNAYRRARRPKRRKLDANPRLRSEVEEMLEAFLSPEQIAARLKARYPEQSEMQISHEAIYRALFVQGRGKLRKELARHLRTGRTRRHPRARAEPVDRFGQMVPIRERPAEASDRAVPGSWEGDLIIGKYNSAIATLVERKSRFVMLVELPDGRDAGSVRVALTRKILTLPENLRRALTWDRGVEMAQHAQFTVDTNVQVYFCDPHSPWQRGTNENTNGLLRQYFPKGTNLKAITPDRLDEVAAQLNDRPRQTLGWKTPSEVLAQAL